MAQMCMDLDLDMDQVMQMHLDMHMGQVLQMDQCMTVSQVCTTQSTSMASMCSQVHPPCQGARQWQAVTQDQMVSGDRVFELIVIY